MKMTFRWYGEKDSISLEYIKQIPNMSGVVTAIYDTPVGEVWGIIAVPPYAPALGCLMFTRMVFILLSSTHRS